jgi:leucyl/phenylalanyl-tRNA---protein transferase
VRSALVEPNGLLAWGGDLHPTRLLNAYRHGIFPWYSSGEPILWWSPDPRAAFETATFRLHRRFRRSLRDSAWQVRADSDFAAVVAACARSPRRGQRGTWITAEMQAAYCELHRLGHAHSVEVHEGARLVGGLYGVATGSVFCGESMFSVESGASKVALGALCRWLHAAGIELLDAQVENPHLETLGAILIDREAYLRRLALPAPALAAPGSWAGRLAPLSAGELA